MVLILVLLTLAASLALELVRTRRREARELAHTSGATASGSGPSAERLFHPGHSWVRVLNPRQTVIGVTEFAQSFIGRVEGVELPATGQAVRQGEPLLTLHRGKRAIKVVSPVSGFLRVVNSRLSTEPSLVNKSPYEDGWVAQIEPENLDVEKRNLLHGKMAERWKETIMAHLRNLMLPELGTVLQDGGRIMDNLGETLTDEVWERLAAELFPLHSLCQSEIKPSRGTKP